MTSSAAASTTDCFTSLGRKTDHVLSSIAFGLSQDGVTMAARHGSKDFYKTLNVSR